MTDSTPSPPTIVPFLRYRDAVAAIDWLEAAFGFERQMVVPGPENTVAHAQLRFGGGVIMLGSATENPLGLVSPEPAAGASQGLYVVVAEVDAHHRRAQAAGAEMVMPLTDQPYGSREYAARDPEGYLWTFGTYQPSLEDDQEGS